MPRLVACGSRGTTYNDFSIAHANASAGHYVAMLVDSEDPVEGIENCWRHLNRHNKWKTPSGADDEQVLLMTTCMETWIATDRQTLRVHFGADLQDNAVPSENMETRSRDSVQLALARATRNCKAPYLKDKRAFELVGKIEPSVLRRSLPSFARMERILTAKL